MKTDTMGRMMTRLRRSERVRYVHVSTHIYKDWATFPVAHAHAGGYVGKGYMYMYVGLHVLYT